MDAIGRVNEVVIDCLDPVALSKFWAAVLGVEATVSHDDWAAVRDASGLSVGFQRVPEPKTGKNRVHLDVEVDHLVGATQRCIELGAAHVGPVVHEGDGAFQVMLDPEGNEYCLVI